MEFTQGSFTGGELDPSLYGRVDLDRYATSLRTCRNFICQPHGGIKNRPGTRFVAETKYNTKVVLIPFEFNNQETYILEFGHEYIRIHTYGAPLLYPTTYATVALRGTPIEVVTPYTVDMLDQIKFTQSANVLILVHPSVRPKRLERREAYSWQLIDQPFKLGPWQPMNTDADRVYTATSTVAVPKVIASTGTLNAAVTIEADQAIFTSEHKDLLFYMEDENFGEPWEVAKTYAAGATCRSDGKYYTTTSGGVSGTLRPTHDSGKWYDGKAGVEWTYVHSGFGVVKLDGVMSESGRKHTGTVMSTIPSTLVGTIGSAAANKTITAATWVVNDFTLTVAGHGLTAGATICYTLNFIDYTGAAKSRSASAIISSTSTNTIVIPTTDEMIYEWGYMTFVTGTITSGAASLAGNSTNLWMFGAWGDTPKLGWPSCVGFHQQRLCFASNTGGPQTLWMSRTDAYDDFGMSNPVQADDAITLNIASQQLNAIKALAPMDRLLILTSGGVWLMGNGQEDAVTPSNSGVKMQGYRGSSDILPLGIGNSMLFIQDKGQVVRDLAYEFQNDSYNTNDMTVMASHLLKGHTISDWAYQAHPFSVVWAVRDDGVLLGMTYMREQKVVAWHQHDTDGSFESVACVSETDVDGLYVVVKRVINGYTKRYIERFADRQSEDLFVDCGGEFTVSTTNSPRSEALEIQNWAYNITMPGNHAWYYPADPTNTTNLYLASTEYTFTAGDVGKVIVFSDAVGNATNLTITSFQSSSLVRITTDRALDYTLYTEVNSFA